MCCGPCGTTTEFLPEGKPAALFFFNPNISPKEEYEKRLQAAKVIANKLGIDIIEGKYNHEDWLRAVKGLEEEPEGGKRCEECFRYRLRAAADQAATKGFENISTTLYASPFKDEKKIFNILKEAADAEGLIAVSPPPEKNAIWKKALERTKEAGIYRQNYCGCEFSIRKRGK